jgi:ABC-type dipeptide/oligopeptide/nickel transport system ATPase component
MIMNRIMRYTVWKLRGRKVMALVGRSGTGKSFRSKLVADKYGIEMIIDDGLLIHGEKIIAGKSAKKEQVFLKAIKTALFDEDDHQEDSDHWYIREDGQQDRLPAQTSRT